MNEYDKAISEYQKPSYFVGRNKVIRSILQQIELPLTNKRNLIEGLPGIGKSSLFEYLFYLIGKKGLPVSKIDGRYIDEPISILKKMVTDWKPKIKFRKFDRGIKEYERILKVLINSKLIPLDILMSFSSKGIVDLNLSKMKDARALDVFGQQSIQVTLESINKLLAAKEINLLFNLQDLLTKMLIADLHKYVANSQKVVLLIDTYDELYKISTWLVDDFIHNLPANIMVVIAGRKLPIADWNEKWKRHTNYIQLDAFTQKEAENYLRKREISNNDQIKTLVQFSKGLPLALSLSADLASQFGISSFEKSPKLQEVVHSLIKVFLREIKNPTLVEILEICAVLKYFDEADFRFFFKRNSRKYFRDISLLSFVSVQEQGMSLHELMRQYILQDLEWRDQARLKGLHQKAGDLYYKKLKLREKDADKMNRLRIYHLIRSDETLGLKLLQSTVDNLIQYRYFGRMELCESFLSEADGYEFRDFNNRILFGLMKAETYMFQTKFKEAQNQYRLLLDMGIPDLSLLSRVEFGYGEVLFRENSTEEARAHFLRSAEISTELEKIETVQYAQTIHSIGDTFRADGRADEALAYYKESLNISRKLDSWFRIADTLHMIATTYRVLTFDYTNCILYLDSAIAEMEKTANESAVGWIFVHKGHAYSLLGDFDKAYPNLEIGKNLIEKYKIPIYRGWARTALGYYHYRVKKYVDAREELLSGIDLFEEGNAVYHKSTALFHLCELLLTLKDDKNLVIKLAELQEHIQRYEYYDVSIQTSILKAKMHVSQKKFKESAYSFVEGYERACNFNENYVNLCKRELALLVKRIMDLRDIKTARRYLDYIAENCDMMDISPFLNDLSSKKTP